ncbi:MAG: TonB-dependent receptor, partial [Proteobacteria bacterium]|nr:TonB-dependent receptor [Pseudomonadota bacterium]
SEAVSKLPFNISAYGSEQLAQGNITSIVGLTQQVPNFTIQNGGARSQASAIPIIRGINASQQQSLSAHYFQSPVGFYLDNAPITGAFPLFDVQRIEVLRGPQGTLYGAGALSGAVRVVPTKPKFDGVSGMVTASASGLAHSSNTNYDVGGTINIPLSDTFAIRASARQGYEAGFIDQKDIFVRQNGDYRYGAPVLANPADVAGSKGILFNKNDVNDTRVNSFRAEALWKPTDATEVSLSYNYAQVKGSGGPVDNPSFNGGAFPIDPRIAIGDLKEYERSLPMLEPFNRRNDLAALDVSHDLGFATLSTTVALGQTKGFSLSDQTVALIGVPYGAYYTGVPANPRTVVPVAQSDRERSVTEEIRLVSKDEGPITYIAGVFMQQMRKNIDINIYAPGAGAQSAAANGGSTLPMALGGTYVLTNADGQSYEQHTTQQFKDYSAYGELSWKVTDRLKLTGGARFFHQTFRQAFTSDSTFFFFSLNEQQKSDVSSQIFKASASYQLADNLQAYGTWSQGFRRGGANSFPLSGPVLEPMELLLYKPDKTDNFELGVKGTLNGVFISADVFYVDWKDPQIDLLTPFNLTNAVVNAKGATSKGFEVEARGPIGDSGLSFNLGFAYAKARLSENFSLPAGSGAGTVVPNAILGSKGDRLPGAPDWSGSFTLNYKTNLGANGQLLISGGVDYRGSTLNALETPDGSAIPREAPASTTLRGNVSYTYQDWTIELFGTNLTDERSVISYARRTASAVAKLGTWSDSSLVSRPREVGLRVTRAF